MPSHSQRVLVFGVPLAVENFKDNRLKRDLAEVETSCTRRRFGITGGTCIVGFSDSTGGSYML